MLKTFRSARVFGFTFVLAAAAFAPKAFAEGNFSLVAAGDAANAKVGGNSNYFRTNVALGGGFLVEAKASPGFGLEFGAIYAPRKLEDRGAGSTDVLTTINVPVLLRFHLADWLSLGLGGFYDRYVGDFKREYIGGGSLETQYGAAGYPDFDYGVMGSLAFRFPLSGSTRLLLDGRYLQGMKDQDFGASKEKLHDVQVLLGLQFGF